MTHMKKTQVYLPVYDLDTLRSLAKQKKKSLASMIREAIQRTWLGGGERKDALVGPVDLWPGDSNQNASIDHDTIYDQP